MDQRERRHDPPEIRPALPSRTRGAACAARDVGDGSERDFAGKATWPYQIEYDLVETNSERNGGHCNVHYGTTNTQTGPHNFSGDLSQWHTYGCELTPGGVTFYLDGNVIKKLTGENVRSKHPHRLGIQLDVDRTGRTGPDTDMLIDWIRVAKLKG